MKSDKKASSVKKTATSKTASAEKKTAKVKAIAPEPEPVKAAKPVRSKTEKAASKVAAIVESALETTKKVATKVKEVAEKAEAKVKKVAAKIEAEAATKPVTAKTAPKEKAETPKKTRVSLKRKLLEIPAILLEGDRPSPPAISGPGQRYSLGPTPPTEHFAEMQELPEAYGTKKLILTARDPHWLYAHWDFTHDQLNKLNALSADGHLILRVYENQISGNALAQAHVHPESRNWFIHVGKGGVKYVAELGYDSKAGKWVQVSASGATITPPDALSDDTSVRFATIPVDVPFEELVRLIKAAVRENIPLAEAIQQLRAEGYTQLPSASDFARFKWMPEQEKALAAMISIDQVRRIWIGSLEITELVRRQLFGEMSSLGLVQLPSSFSLASLSSPFGGMEKQKGFWFNVNAELIIYGATEPDATVTIGGRKINLRKDGTFSYRFILPDGNYDLPAQAVSADGDDTRSAHLKFSRATKYHGEVGAHPQDKNMKPPLVENVV